VVAQKLARLQTIVAERVVWADQLAQIKRLHGWLLEVEHLLDASPAQEAAGVSNATVGSRLDAWRAQMSTELIDGAFSELERECLTEFLRAALAEGVWSMSQTKDSSLSAQYHRLASPAIRRLNASR
jgi:hypothetical protein